MATPKVLEFKTSSPQAPKTSVVTKIISVGKDHVLLRLREKILTSDGRSVRSLTPEEAEIEARSPEGRIWIFCNTVELVQLVYLASSIRRYSPGSRLLLIEDTKPTGFEATLFHRVIKPTDGIDTLLAAIFETELAS